MAQVPGPWSSAKTQSAFIATPFGVRKQGIQKGEPKIRRMYVTAKWRVQSAPTFVDVLICITMMERRIHNHRMLRPGFDSPWGRQRLSARGLFSDERPRNFGNLTVVVVHEVTMA